MTRAERLRKEALEATKMRGHIMGRFKHTGKEAIAYCKKCGFHAHVVAFFSYEIFGEAVALDCGDKA